MIKYIQYLIIAWIITSHLESFYSHTYLFATHEEKVEADVQNHMGTGGLQSFKVNVRPSSFIISYEFLHGKKRQSADNASHIICLFIGKTLRKRGYLLQNLHKKNYNRNENSQGKQTHS